MRVLSTVAGVSEAYEDAANCLWLLTNSKPCANCKSPIQKNEGCNHMQCAKVDTLVSLTVVYMVLCKKVTTDCMLKILVSTSFSLSVV